MRASRSLTTAAVTAVAVIASLAGVPAAAAVDGQTVTAAARRAKALKTTVRAEVDLASRGAVKVPVNTRVQVAATVRPARAGRTVLLQVASDPAWATLGRARTRGNGTATFTVPTDETGRSTYRLVTPARPGVVAASSLPVVVIVVEEKSDQDTPPEAPAAPDTSAPVGSADAFSLFDTASGGVFRWNPCSPIRYRVNLAGGPAALAADTSEAVRRLSAATGLIFVDAGTTDYSGSFADAGQAKWPADTDLLITVAPESAAPDLAGSTVGYASVSGSSTAGSDVRISRSEVVLEREFVTKAPAGFPASGRGTGQLLLHELGHAVGLDHSQEDSQIMYPSLSGVSTYQNGDLAGLARVGVAAGCF